jgi:type-F conjugative transfer system pilin assembly protein TrbC
MVFQLNCRAQVELYALVSSSMPIHDIASLSIEAKQINAGLFINGLINNSFKDTASFAKQLIDKSGHGVFIDENVFQEFKVTKAPCFILVNVTDTGEWTNYDKLCGNVSLDYALDEFSKRGELSIDARKLLGKLRGRND